MINKEKLRMLLTDIRFWIVIFFLIRLTGITNAPLESAHNWRQALTAMIARNFLETGPELRFPRIDMAGNQSGIIGSEFPFFNYLVYLSARIFGYDHWYGRLINLIVSTTGIYAFFLLVRRWCSRQVAFNASIVLLSSVWFAFSRKIMPDTFSVSLVIIGLYFASRYLDTGSPLKLGLYLLFSTLGTLCKIPALSLMVLALLPGIAGEIPRARRIGLLLATAAGIGVMGLWYFYWVPRLIALFGYQLYFPKGIAEGFRELLPWLPDFFEKFYFTSLSSYLALPFCLWGFWLIFTKGTFYLKAGLLLCTFTFMVFVVKTGAVFPLHSYYIIPFTPVMALAAGYALHRIPAPYLCIPLILIPLEGVLNQQHDFFIRNSQRYLLTLEGITAYHIPPHARIVINGGPSPQEIYFAHRKGWTVTNEKINLPALNRFKSLGAHFLIINRHSPVNLPAAYQLLYSDANFEVLRL